MTKKATFRRTDRNKIVQTFRQSHCDHHDFLGHDLGQDYKSDKQSRGLKNGMKLTTATALKPCKDSTHDLPDKLIIL